MRKTTMQVCRELKVSYWVVVGLLRSGRIPQPEKNLSGDYEWALADVQAAKRALEEEKAVVAE